MRRILVDSARRKQAGQARRRPAAPVDLDADALAAPEPDRRPRSPSTRPSAAWPRHDPVKARLVKLRYFAGLTGDQAAAALGLSPSTADRLWVFARAWLRRELGFGDEA